MGLACSRKEASTGEVARLGSVLTKVSALTGTPGFWRVTCQPLQSSGQVATKRVPSGLGMGVVAFGSMVPPCAANVQQELTTGACERGAKLWPEAVCSFIHGSPL